MIPSHKKPSEDSINCLFFHSRRSKSMIAGCGLQLNDNGTEIQYSAWAQAHSIIISGNRRKTPTASASNQLHSFQQYKLYQALEHFCVSCSFHAFGNGLVNKHFMVMLRHQQLTILGMGTIEWAIGLPWTLDGHSNENHWKITRKRGKVPYPITRVKHVQAPGCGLCMVWLMFDTQWFEHKQKHESQNYNIICVRILCVWCIRCYCWLIVTLAKGAFHFDCVASASNQKNVWPRKHIRSYWERKKTNIGMLMSAKIEYCFIWSKNNDIIMVLISKAKM